MPRGREVEQKKMKFALILNPDGPQPDLEVFDSLKERCDYVDVLREVDVPHALFPSPAPGFGIAEFVSLS